MTYLEYYADTMLWSAVVTFALGLAAGLAVLFVWVRNGSRLAQVGCPHGGNALVRYSEVRDGVEISTCPLRADGRACSNACAPALQRAAARLRA